MRLLLFSLNWVEYQVQMANALAERGHRCDVVFKASRVEETLGDALPDLVDPRVAWHLLDDRPRGLRDPRQWHTAWRLIRLIRRISPDVILLHEATQSYLPWCLRFAGGHPILLTVHDVTTHPGEDSREPGRRDRVRQFLRRRAAAVVVHGESLRRAFLAQDGSVCRDVTAVPHGCYTFMRHWARPGRVERPRSLLFFGRLHEYKGLSVLLRAVDLAARDVPDLKVVIAGTGADIRARLGEVESHPRCVVHHGYLSNEKVAEIFQTTQVAVLPYLEGSQSGVVRVAYAFGKPVIVTDVGSIPESVPHGVTGLVVPPGDEVALARAIVTLLGDDARRQAMGRAAMAMADGEMSWRNVAARTEPILRRIARQRGSMRALGADPQGGAAAQTPEGTGAQSA